ncbi:hypothetical protein SDC9_91656 [bioreactor metagenome]|uniref:Conjugal transfer protein TraL n=1 Tax=bioreactor metagenome TaxID=1076179 RepID=A0A644ZYE9_9ZZZZ
MRLSGKRTWVPFLATGAGAALFLLMLYMAGSLRQGGPGQRLAAVLLLLALGILALLILAGQGYSRQVVLACLLPVALALLLRLVCLDHITLDFEDFLAPWAAAFRAGGGFAAVRRSIGNYNVPYLYFMAAISYVAFPDLYAIKLFSILFDVLLAWGGLRLVRILCPDNRQRPLIAFLALLFLPTVVLNGAYWGQCDSIYAALLLHALACALEDKPSGSMFLLALAFSFKLQAIFLLPLWCVLWYSGRVRLRQLLQFPLWYALTIAPALLLGKPLKDVLGVYLGQMGQYTTALTYNAPSVYALLPRGLRVDTGRAALAGILAAFLLVLALLAVLFLVRKRMTAELVLTAAVILAVGVPFLLPYMHERYFFTADVLTLVWACAIPRRLSAAVGTQLASLGGYHAYLRLRYAIPVAVAGLSFPMGVEAALLLAVLTGSIAILWKRIGHSIQ